MEELRELINKNTKVILVTKQNWEALISSVFPNYWKPLEYVHAQAEPPHHQGAGYKLGISGPTSELLNQNLHFKMIGR